MKKWDLNYNMYNLPNLSAIAVIFISCWLSVFNASSQNINPTLGTSNGFSQLSKKGTGWQDNEPKLPAVTQIRWKNFNKKLPEEPIFNSLKIALSNVNKYALNDWYIKVNEFDTINGTDNSGYLILKSKGKDNQVRYRYPAGMTFGIAIALKTGAYDYRLTGVPTVVAAEKAIKLLSAIAYDHKANQKRNVWGGDWQAAHWAYYTGYSAWLLWEKLEIRDQNNIKRMIISEADRLLKIDPPYCKDKTGKVLIPGDSKIEENAWNAELLYLASVMMPTHANSRLWYDQSLNYIISGVSLPSDLENNNMLHGRPVRSWLNGYNVEEPGVVVNHHIVHPLYNALSSVVNAPIVFSLAGKNTPKAAAFNMDKIYNSLITTKFDSVKYQKPGGTMYIPGQAQVYYPEGSDWGKEIYDSFVNMDIAAWMYGFDKGDQYNGKYWAQLHLDAVVKQQSRFSDGHTYLDNNENNYSGKEAAIATRIASAWMTVWMQYQSPVKYK
ncbi:hypothetical protein [Pedobacter frigoris]|uniref:Uncharacterized protein n=1 Tax=Pedobacter frigoris TaxID=2571272 RepID=A0A4U1CPM0_9SPHI|nr:hypothetical protein [Pedobacter frigoris]TKC08830.1 hypothetical protein FA047_01670 [Pedobacter frigoris]